MDINSISPVPNGQLYITGTDGKKKRGKKHVQQNQSSQGTSSGNKSSQRQPFRPRTIAEKEKIITAVSKHPNIWKKDSESYHNRDSALISWQEISTEVEIPAEECKLLWRNLRDSFGAKYRKVKEGKSGDGLNDVADGAKARKWLFFDQLLFLADTMAFRTTDTNFEDSGPASVESRDDEILAGDIQDIQDTSVDLSQLFEVSETPTSSRSSFVGNRKGRKRTATEQIFEHLGKHMDAVGKALAEPLPLVTNKDRFVQYLGGILQAVPSEKIRKCEQDILIIANAYADGKSIQLVEIEDL